MSEIKTIAKIVLGCIALTVCAIFLAWGLAKLIAPVKHAETSTTVNQEFVVQKLFTHEGCTVYRFEDGGRLRYFTANCHGSTQWTESCGKNCSRDMRID